MSFGLTAFVFIKGKKVFWLPVPLKNLIPLATQQSFHQHKCILRGDW